MAQHTDDEAAELSDMVSKAIADALHAFQVSEAAKAAGPDACAVAMIHGLANAMAACAIVVRLPQKDALRFVRMGFKDNSELADYVNMVDNGSAN